MIRGYCTVCQDLISHIPGREQGGEVACGPCGHVFHLMCLSTWLNRKKTCPKCREKISKPTVLYIDEEQQSDESCDDDVQTLRAKLEHLKCLIKQKDEENNDLLNERIQYQDILKDTKMEVASMKKQLKSEMSVTTALKKQMNFLKKQEIEVAEAKREAMSSKQELQRLSRLKILVEGTREDVDDMLHSIRNDGSATTEMITQLAILKKELEKIKESRNKARQAKENCEREMTKLKQELSSKDIEIHQAKEQLQLTESYLSRSEDENSSLKRKLSKLEEAFNSPSPRSSAITRLMRESPAPMELKRPRLTAPEDDSENDILTNNGSTRHDEPDNEMKQAAEGMGLQVVKTTSAQFKKPIRAPQRPPLLTLHAKKRRVEEGVIRKGFDGLGGHTQFFKPSKPRGPLKKVARPTTISKFIKTTVDGKPPPLPVLNLDDL